MDNLMQKITALAKRRGFIFSGSEIYGGLSGTWDYGPLGVELKNNIKREFWKNMVYERENIVGIDAAILMNPKIWEASGHVEAFSDPLVECKLCHERFRADNQEGVVRHEKKHGGRVEWTPPRKFNLLVETKLGAVEGGETRVWLRGEITQGAHVNFKNILDTSRLKIPFGIAQIGKAFRNEITPGDFTFRSREFEQMELQWYIQPEGTEARKWFEYWKEERMKWYLSLGMRKEKLRMREHGSEERAHYARAAWDIEYESPWGWRELEGIHNRGDWDLMRHTKFSGEDLTYLDEETKECYLTWVIETSGGVDRAALFFLLDAYREEKNRVILKLHPKLAPYKIAVFPLLANRPDLVKKAREIFSSLKSKFSFPIVWDDRGNIGKRYYSQDEIGTPWCATVDYETLESDRVTVRERDTAQQERVSWKGLADYFKERLN